MYTVTPMCIINQVAGKILQVRSSHKSHVSKYAHSHDVEENKHKTIGPLQLLGLLPDSKFGKIYLRRS